MWIAGPVFHNSWMFHHTAASFSVSTQWFFFSVFSSHTHPCTHAHTPSHMDKKYPLECTCYSKAPQHATVLHALVSLLWLLTCWLLGKTLPHKWETETAKVTSFNGHLQKYRVSAYLLTDFTKERETVRGNEKLPCVCLSHITLDILQSNLNTTILLFCFLTEKVYSKISYLFNINNMKNILVCRNVQ